jgi:hypothetical protein
MQILEKQVKDRVKELNRIQNELKKSEDTVRKQTSTIQEIVKERDSLKYSVERLFNQKNTIENNQESQQIELNMCKDKLLAAETCKEMLHTQLTTVSGDLTEANKKIDSYLETIKDIENKNKNSDAEKNQLEEKVKSMQIDYESRIEKINGSYFALRKAHSHLEQRLRDMNQSRDQELYEQKRQTDRYRRENEELRDRLRVGAKEYARLIEKYQNLKYQSAASAAASNTADLGDDQDSNFGDNYKRNSMYDFINQQYQKVLYSTSPDEEYGANLPKSSSMTDNTIINAMLSPFYNSPTERNTKLQELYEKRTSSPPQPTTTQPKMFSSSKTQVEDNDEGLVHIIEEKTSYSSNEDDKKSNAIAIRPEQSVMERNRNLSLSERNQKTALLPYNHEQTISEYLRLRKFNLQKKQNDYDLFEDQFNQLSSQDATSASSSSTNLAKTNDSL